MMQGYDAGSVRRGARRGVWSVGCEVLVAGYDVEKRYRV
jgi:hypothetical protein